MNRMSIWTIWAVVCLLVAAIFGRPPAFSVALVSLCSLGFGLWFHWILED